MASPESKIIDDLFDSILVTMAEKPDMELPEIRALLEKCGDIATDPGGVDYIEEEIVGTTCLWAVPKNCAEDRVLLSFHGGGCVTGSRFSHRKMFAHIAKAFGCRALIPDYGRAPENQAPSQVNEGLAIYDALLQSGIKAEHIATIGDSAGGNLCTAVVLAAKDQGKPLPACVMPMSPWYDMEAVGESFTKNADNDRLVKKELSLNMSGMYIGDTPANNPLVNPLYADFTGFPPTYMQVGGYESLLDDALRASESAKKAGVEIRCDVFPEMQHVFQFMAGNAPEADDAIQRLAAWAKPKLGL